MVISHDVRSCLDFLDDFQELDIHVDYFEAVENALLRLQYVDKAWIASRASIPDPRRFDHTCLIEVHFETDRFDVSARRLKIVKQKVRRVLERYSRYSLTKH